MTTITRKGCGTYLALRLHHANGEDPCSECLRGEAIRRVEVEGIPRRLPRADRYAPVTETEAAANRAVLARELDAFEEAHPNASGNRRRGSLRLVRSHDAA